MVRSMPLATTRDMPDETTSAGKTNETTQKTDAEAWPPAAIPARQHPKVLLSLRLDHDVLKYFRMQGPGYQTRMNAVLRAYVEYARGKPAASDD